MNRREMMEEIRGIMDGRVIIQGMIRKLTW